jgi:HlyD family secretion protein
MTQVTTQGEAGASPVGPSALARAQSPRRARPARAWLAAGAALAFGVVGFWYWRAHAPVKATYATAAIDVGAVARSVTASGTVNPVLTIVVGSYVSGVIQDIACDYNTQVRKGQVCATIDPRPYRLQVEQDQAALQTAKAQLMKDQANLQYQTANAARYARLLSQDSTSRDLAENARNLRDQSAAQIALDKAAIAQRQAALHASEVNLGYTRITSPVDGTVVSRNVTIGQTVAASFQTPTLFLIAQDLTKMQVDTNVSESDIGGEAGGVRVGDPVTFTVEAFPNHTFHGVVSQVRQSPQTVQNVVTYDVVVAVDNRRLQLKPGMTATVKIITAQRAGVLRAPNPALRFIPGGIGGTGRSGQRLGAVPDRLWVLKGGKPSTIPVRTGLSDDNYTELTGGDVRAGQQVITAQLSGGARKPGRSGAPAPRL